MATRFEGELGIRFFDFLPLQVLRPSALIDFILLFIGSKPAIRLLADSDTVIDDLRLWCLQVSLDFAVDNDKFVCISRVPGYASYVLEIDQRADEHEVDLGIALGYPLCCCERIALIGESNIDAYAEEISTWTFTGQYKRIDPTGYLIGLSLISHLPCSPFCDASLEIATKTRQFILAHAKEPFCKKFSDSSLIFT